MAKSYVFQSIGYHSVVKMLDTIIYEFMVAGGHNGPDAIKEILDLQDNASLAAECVEMWGLDQGDRQAVAFGAEGVRSHMERHGYDRDDLTEAFERFRASRRGQ